jgi:hypothetical protein
MTRKRIKEFQMCKNLAKCISRRSGDLLKKSDKRGNVFSGVEKPLIMESGTRTSSQLYDRRCTFSISLNIFQFYAISYDFFFLALDLLWIQHLP